jgi:hypothetical protein
VLDDELAQVVGVGGRDPQQVVGLARHVEDREHAGQRADVLGERLDLLARVHRQADGDQRLQRAPEGREVDLGVEAPDHSAPAQRAHPRQRGRGSHADGARQARVGDARVGGEQLEQAAVDVVQSIVRHGRHCGRAGRTIVDKQRIGRRMFW